MNGIQVLLIAGVILILAYYILRFRNALVDLIILFSFSALAIFFIVAPENTNQIAHKLGVGRGADLLFYICILFFLFIIIKLFARLRRLEEKFTDLIRQKAKDEVTDKANKH